MVNITNFKIKPRRSFISIGKCYDLKDLINSVHFLMSFLAILAICEIWNTAIGETYDVRRAWISSNKILDMYISGW